MTRTAASRLSCRRDRRAMSIIAVVLLLAFVNLIVVGMVTGGARDQDSTVHRVRTMRSYYAAEAGANMALREIVLNTDEDGDGGVGSISDDGDDGNNPRVISASFGVEAATVGAETQLTATGREGESTRSVVVSFEAAGSGGGGGAGAAMIAYGLNGQSAPRYRVLTDGAWGAAAVANSVGSTPQWLVLRAAPDGERFALATLDNDVDVEVQFWDGSAWGAVYQATSDAGDKSTRVFDLAFEQSSGDALLVYRESGTNSVRYRTYDGSSWSAEQSISLTGDSPPDWLRLVSRPGGDEMILTVAHDGDELAAVAAVWNGSSFGDIVTLLDEDGSSQGEFVAGAWESMSGDGIAVVRDDDDSPRRRSFVADAWTGAAAVPAVGADPRWIRLYRAPASDDMLMVSLDDDLDLNANNWSGSAWGANVQLESGMPTDSARHFDLAWEAGGARAILAYGDSGSNVLKYRTWNGSAWTAESSGPNGGNSPIWHVQAVEGVDEGHVLVAWCMDNGQLRTATWSSGGFGGATVLGISSAPKEYETFMIASGGGGSGAATFALAGWTEAAP
jgi:hypothetical protein